MPDPTGKLSERLFIKKLREQLPELAEFSDGYILKSALEEDPTIADSVELLSNSANRDAARYDRRSQSYVDPEMWDRHPNLKALTKGTLDTLPGLGAVAGGAIGGAETFGTGIPWGATLGIGAGKGLRDIAAQGLGIEEPNTPVEKAMGIAGDMTLGATAPGIIESVLHPKTTGRLLAGYTADIGDALPPALRRWIAPSSFLRSVEGRGAGVVDPLVRPSWQTTPGFADDVLEPEIPMATRTGSPSAPPPNVPTTATLNVPVRPTGPTPSTTSMVPGTPLPTEPVDVNSALRGFPPLNIQGSTGMGTSASPPLPTGPTNFGVSVQPRPNIQGSTGVGTANSPGIPTGPIQPTFTRPSGTSMPAPKPTTPKMTLNNKMTNIVGNEERVIRPNWNDEQLKYWQDKGFKPGGRTPDGKFYMTKPVSATTTPNVPDVDPIIQHSPSTGKVRGSFDNGQTWKYSNDGGETWSDVE